LPFVFRIIPSIFVPPRSMPICICYTLYKN
jgi:hypothetical protein